MTDVAARVYLEPAMKHSCAGAVVLLGIFWGSLGAACDKGGVFSAQELAASRVVRQRIARMTPLDALQSVLSDMKRHPTNAALVAALAP